MLLMTEQNCWCVQERAAAALLADLQVAQLLEVLEALDHVVCHRQPRHGLAFRDPLFSSDTVMMCGGHQCRNESEDPKTISYCSRRNTGSAENEGEWKCFLR